MPSINVQISAHGPIVDAFVGISNARLQALLAAGIVPPPPQPVRLLIDTGASMTNVCSSVMANLGMSPTGQINVLTPSTGGTPVQMDTYDVNLYFGFPGRNIPVHTVPTVPIVCTDFQAQGIQGLIGRDILQKSVLIYNGEVGISTLSF